MVEVNIKQIPCLDIKIKMTDCTKLQVFKDGVCIAESLGKCKGCANEFFKDLEGDGFSGLKITAEEIKPFGKI